MIWICIKLCGEGWLIDLNKNISEKYAENLIDDLIPVVDEVFVY